MVSWLSGKWVLITGASSGIGAAAARAFGTEGASLLLGARRVERLSQVADDAARAGASRALYHSLDVSSITSVERFVEWVRANVPAVHVLVNNAGGAHGLDPVADAKDSDWEAMFQSNVLGLLRMTREVLPLVPHDAGSTIINVGSVAGHDAYEGGAAYCAAKAGELQITRALRLELCGTGIRVGTVDPGLTETEFSLVRFKGDAERASDVYRGMVPLSADDVAQAVVWVASRPAHVNIDEVILKPVAQAAVHKIARRGDVERAEGRAR
jgi:NADP-dependent 3-hydroxy acid dehydrogenase YdfG